MNAEKLAKISREISRTSENKMERFNPWLKQVKHLKQEEEEEEEMSLNQHNDPLAINSLFWPESQLQISSYRDFL